MKYVPGRFSEGNSSFGRKLWAFVNEHDSKIAMEVSTYVGLPAVAGLEKGLLERFKDEDVRPNRIKQMIGHMVRQVMESLGYALDAQGVNSRPGRLFSTGSRYRKANA